MPRSEDMPLSVRLGPDAWTWLQAEAGRRSRLAGVPIGPSSIVRAIVEHAAKGGARRETIQEFRRRLRVKGLGLTPTFFEGLRDRRPEPDVQL